MRKKRLLYFLFILCCCTILLAPGLVMMISQSGKLELLEKRKAAEFPELSLQEGIQFEVESFLNDNFGFRPLLIRLNSKLKLFLFKSTPDPRKVQYGKSKWLFYNSKASRAYGSYSRRNYKSSEELAYFEEILKERTANNRREGRRYISVIWPNKHSIYPEYFNELMNLQLSNNPSLLSQLTIEFKEENKSLEFYSVMKEMREKKKERQVYHKFDTHWNDYGANYAFSNFLEQAFPEIRPLYEGIRSYTVKEIDYCKGDLLGMMAIETSRIFCEINPVFHYELNAISHEMISWNDGSQKAEKITSPVALSTQSLLIFGDSYCDKLLPLFGKCFKEVVLIKEYYNEKAIQELQPDIVISANVERNISL